MGLPNRYRPVLLLLLTDEAGQCFATLPTFMVPVMNEKTDCCGVTFGGSTTGGGTGAFTGVTPFLVATDLSPSMCP